MIRKTPLVRMGDDLHEMLWVIERDDLREGLASDGPEQDVKRLEGSEQNVKRLLHPWFS